MYVYACMRVFLCVCVCFRPLDLGSRVVQAGLDLGLDLTALGCRVWCVYKTSWNLFPEAKSQAQYIYIDIYICIYIHIYTDIEIEIDIYI